MSAKVTAKAVSQISEQLPSFIGEDFPLYEKFVKNYYEFLETVCVYYDIVEGYENAFSFTMGETVTGQTSGATAKVKGTGANSGTNKLFLEPTNTLDFVEETIIGSTSNSYGKVTRIVRNPINALKLFSTLIDPSQTSEGVLDFFKKEFYPNLRKSSTTDLRKFIQHLKDFYRSKGSEKSFKTLFRILYGQENVDFTFPKTDLLKVSAGNWSQDIVIQLKYDVQYFNFNGLTITGTSSKTTAFVSNITTRKLGTISIIELVLTNATSIFTLGETISATTASGVTITATVTGQMTDISIDDGGVGYLDGQQLVITDPASLGFGAAATVARTSRDQVVTMNITNSGNGFQVNDPFVFDNTGTNADVTAEAKVRTIIDPYDIDVISTRIFEVVETVSFNIIGASVLLPFSVSVQTGFLIGNNSNFSDATKVGEIVSLTNQELHIYDRGNEPNRIGLEDDSGYIELEDSTDNILNENITLSKFVDGDQVFVFDKNGASISGSSSATIFDSTFQNPNSNVDINAVTYGANLNNTSNISQFIAAMTFTTETFGKIETIDLVSHGSGYEAVPTATIENDYYSNLFEPDGISFKGRNAIIDVGALGGSIVDIKGGTISESGFGYITPPTVVATANTLASGSSSASLSAILTANRTKDGFFTDDQGKVSSSKKLQDNDYFQDFSYVIKTSDSINTWRQDILKLLHPAGLKLFGEVSIENNVNLQLFDRGNNNINSVDESGLGSLYRDLILIFLIETLNDPSVLVDASLEELTYILSPQLNNNLNIQNNLGTQFNADIFLEYVRLILSSLGIPAEFFAYMSVKSVNNVSSVEDKFGLEDGTGSLLKEDSARILTELGSKTVVQTTDPHYFHEGDEIYLDNFEGTPNSIGLEDDSGSLILESNSKILEEQNTSLPLINERRFKVTEVDVENSSFLIDSTDTIRYTELEDGSGIILLEEVVGEDGNYVSHFLIGENFVDKPDEGDFLLYEDGSHILNESISLFTLSQPNEFQDLDFDTSSMSIAVNGNIFRPAKTACAGHVTPAYLGKEYVGEYLTYDIDSYVHYNPTDLSFLTKDTVLEFREKDLTLTSNILTETGDDLLLETGNLVLGDDGNISDFTIAEKQQKVVFGGFLVNENDNHDDKIILEDIFSNGGIELEETGVVNGVVTFDEPFDYKGHPYTNSKGLLYTRHYVDQKVSV